ncbi:hypothetical protein GF412_05365 [Candidatus Micrarchaeota archaeon]|nr:hypothetical protein [Candidatus Micrarchaeota archaeon]MBD3418380.1 hypothetical protein [Candidatus Micrarchaeota archaeon]
MKHPEEKRKKFLSFLEKYKDAKLVVTSHSNFDLDALCSCIAVKSVLPNGVVACPDKMDAPAKAFAEKLGLRVEKLGKLDKGEFEGLVSVDCATSVLLEEAKGWDIRLIVDHHHKSENALSAEFMIVDEDAPSTAEIFGELLPEVSEEVAFALGVAIISDTARFKSARAHTFEMLAKMIRISGKEYSEMLEDAEPELDMENKLTVLEAFKNMRIQMHGGYAVVTSVVPAHESLVSSSLSEFADIAFVAKWKDEVKESRVSSRARKHVPFMMNEIMKEAAEELGGGGGGHAKAAGCSSKARPGETLDKCIEVLIRKINEV